MKKHDCEFSREFLERWPVESLKRLAMKRFNGLNGERTKDGIIGHILATGRHLERMYGMEALARNYALAWTREREDALNEHKAELTDRWDQCGLYEPGFEVRCRKGRVNVSLCYGISCDFTWTVDELLEETAANSENRNTFVRVQIKTDKTTKPEETAMSMNKGAIMTLKEELKEQADEFLELQERAVSHAEKLKHLVLTQGQMLDEIHQKHGRPGITAFCELVGIDEISGYNRIRLYQNRENPHLLAQSQRKAIALLPLVEDPDVEIGDGEITYKLDAKSDITLPFDPKAMSAADLRTLGQYLRKIRRKSADLEKALAEGEEAHKKEILALRDTIEKTQARVNTLLGEAEDDPYEEMLNDLDKAITSVGKQLRNMMGEAAFPHLTALQKEKLGALCGVLANHGIKTGEEIAMAMEM